MLLRQDICKRYVSIKISKHHAKDVILMNRFLIGNDIPLDYISRDYLHSKSLIKDARNGETMDHMDHHGPQVLEA